MSKFAEITEISNMLDKKLPFLHGGIGSPEEHNVALELIDELIEDYDKNVFLINSLYTVIERYENEAPEFEGFNADIESLNSATAVLNVLMDQHNLKADDLKNEIGSKNMVSMILNGKRKLTLNHIYKLANRFSIDPKLFV